MLDVKIEGIDDVRHELGFLKSRSSQAIKRGLFKAASIVRNAAARGIAKPPKSGRIYRRGGVEHQASKAGEYPAADTGRLMGSLTHRVDAIKLESFVEAATKYAAPLELKPPERGGRPFLSRALEANRLLVIAAINDALNEALTAADRKATRT